MSTPPHGGAHPSGVDEKTSELVTSLAPAINDFFNHFANYNVGGSDLWPEDKKMDGKPGTHAHFKNTFDEVGFFTFKNTFDEVGFAHFKNTFDEVGFFTFNEGG